MPETGDRVPDLPLALSSGKAATLGDYAGKWLVLYFYPKDSTPACTAEGQDFNALLPDFKRAGAQVLGPIAAELAYGEGLQAHAQAAEFRLKGKQR